MTVGSLLQNPKYTEKFVLEKLLCLFLQCTREELWTDEKRQLDDDQVQKILSAYDDYVVKKKPLEYVMGYVEFFWNKFLVNEATLIPRPETEYMITAVTEYINWKLSLQDKKIENWKLEKALLLDIGTGCGVLWISVLLQNPNFFAEVVFSDYYGNALDVAKKNFEFLISNFEWKVSFVESDLLEFWNDRRWNNWEYCFSCQSSLYPWGDFRCECCGQCEKVGTKTCIRGRRRWIIVL